MIAATDARSMTRGCSPTASTMKAPKKAGVCIPTGDIGKTAVYAGTAGLVAGAALGASLRARKQSAVKNHERVTIDDLDQES